MKQAWTVLTNRRGSDIRAPSETQLTNALAEIFGEQHSESVSNDSDNDASVILRFGYQDGLMYVLEIVADGTVIFEEWADEDRELELEKPKKMYAVTQAQAMELWRCMAQRQVAQIRKQPWH